MGKSLYGPILDLFRLYAHTKIHRDVVFRSEFNEASVIDTAQRELELRVTSSADDDDFGRLHKTPNGIPVHDADGGEYYVSPNRVEDWLCKVDRQAVAGKQIASFELTYGPFSLFYSTNKTPKITRNQLARNVEEAVKDIIFKNK